MAAEQMSLFEPDTPIKKVRKKKQVSKKKTPSKKKAAPKKEAAKKVAPRFRLAKGEIAYMCPECDDKPTIYTKIIPKLTCPKCKMLVEVVNEKL
ncbi:hypothetical protein P4661_27500 [Priestia megaterium]|uniref:hypothetical protein n=1 Tax=Priestia megaterium TaxID=1404 RepID=UPI002E1BD7B7|nr:hypothetical protein [Priestia megaterium]